MQTRVSFILIFLFIMLLPMRVNSQIVTGAEQMDQYLPLLKGKRIGMVVNHTSVVGRKQVHLLLIKERGPGSQSICSRAWFPW